MARLPRNAQAWKDRAEIDYIGPFVKAWAAFNAWYREETGTRRDRDGLDYVKGRVNAIRSEILPYLAPVQNEPGGHRRADSDEAQEFKLLIAQLHGRLEQFRIEVERDNGAIERITFSAVPGRRASLPQVSSYAGMGFKVDKSAGQWTSTVTNRRGQITKTIIQANYDEEAFITGPDFLSLSTTQQSRFRALYQSCSPNPVQDLFAGSGPLIAAGDLEFRCTDIELFGGLVEVVYALRNALLHGDLQADERAFQAYEPAYRIVMKFLKCVH